MSSGVPLSDFCAAPNFGGGCKSFSAGALSGVWTRSIKEWKSLALLRSSANGGAFGP
jgi:hypothetical protein